MISIPPTNTAEFPFSPNQFDAGYYGGSARGGFGAEIEWAHPQQQVELQNKLDMVNETGPFNTILFVGCATGNEIRFFRDKGKDAQGVEISEWAVAHADPSINAFLHLYDGWNLSQFGDRTFDIVASFDVLTLVPHEMLLKLVPEMCRVSASRIVFRTPIDVNSDQNGQFIGNDGVTFRCLTQAQWCEIFEQHGFKMTRIQDTNNVPGERLFVFTKS